MRFSILIPVYNVEKYLPKCLDSVLAQNFADYEVILVNDGSKDRSPEICENYAKKDSRIKYFSKDNEGLLLTRRYSIKRAAGEYVLFLDSDDFWREGLLEFLDDAIKRTGADIVTYRFCRMRDDETPIYNDVDVFPGETYFDEDTKEDFIRAFVSSSRLNTMWSKCVKRSVIDSDADYSGYKDRKGEDLLQSIALIRNAKTILYTNEVFYNYRLSPSGRGRNFKLSYLADYEVVRRHVYEELLRMNVTIETIKAFYCRYISGLLGFLSSLACYCKNNREFAEECARIREYELFKKASHTLTVNDVPSEVRKEYKAVVNGKLKFLYYTKKVKRVAVNTVKKWIRRH